MATDRRIGGILLCGGSSSRLGVDKATLLVDDVALSRRVASELVAIADPAVEVGSGVSGLWAVREDPSGSGPLAALVAGYRALVERGHTGEALVVACDLPFIDRGALSVLARWPGHRSVVPLVDDIAQPLCARWSGSDLERAAALVGTGERSMHALLDATDPDYVDATQECGPLNAHVLEDIDTVEDAQRFGLLLATPGQSRASSVRSEGAGAPGVR